MKANTVKEGLRETISEMEIDYVRMGEDIAALKRALIVVEGRSVEDRDVAPVEISYAAMMRDAIEAVLREQQPLHRGEILKRLEARDFPLTAKDKMRSIGHHLTTSSLFVNVIEGKGFWALRDWTPPLEWAVMKREERVKYANRNGEEALMS